MPKVPLELYRLGHIIKEECGIWSQKTLVFLLGPFNPSLLNLFQLLLSQKIKIINGDIVLIICIQHLLCSPEVP